MSGLDLTRLEGPPEHALRHPILDTIWHHYNQTPRNVQVALGPSEIGEPCTRRLAYSISHYPPRSAGGDPLPAIIGTAAHTWLEAACHEWNEFVGQTVWIVEQELHLPHGIVGHCDAYHVPSRTVVDWKFVGTEPMARYRKNGPGHRYRRQAHLYAHGWAGYGVPVDQVAIVFFSRGGLLSGMHIWSEAYNTEVAEETLARYQLITATTQRLDLTNPANYRLYPTEAGHHCTYCPWFTPGPDTGDGCPGYTQKEKS